MIELLKIETLIGFFWIFMWEAWVGEWFS